MPPISMSRSRSRGRSRWRTPPPSSKKRRAASSLASRAGEFLFPRSHGLRGAATQTESARTTYSTAGMGSTIKKKKRKGKKNRRRQKKMTVDQIQRYGITMCQEIRWKTKVNDSGSKNEAVALGHTSMPVKISVLNLCRALMKHVWVKMGIQNIDYSRLLGSYYIQTGDIIRFNFYNGWSATSVTSSDVFLGENNSFDYVPYQLSRLVNAYGNPGYIRFDSIQFVPYDSASRFPAINLTLSTLKVAVTTKSVLKVQNRSIAESGDDLADTVDNVPIQGTLFTTKGNNFIRKGNSVLLKSVDASNGLGNETVVYGAWTRNTTALTGGTDYEYIDAAGQGPVNKPAEVPKKNEIESCVSATKFIINPGVIRTSVLNKTFQMSFDAYMHLLLNSKGGTDNELTYDRHLGFTNTLYMEKVIGANDTDVSVSAECEFRQSVVVFGKNQSQTLPLTYQSDYVQV